MFDQYEEQSNTAGLNYWKIGTGILLGIIVLGAVLFIGIKLGSSTNEETKSVVDTIPLLKPKETQVEGQVFIVTRGGQNFKLGLVTVALYKMGKKDETELSKEVKTDSDGKFNVTLPQGNYKVMATSSRRTFDETEQYIWNFPVTLNQEKQQLFLSNDNMKVY